MKKRILNFALAFCMILASAFALVACGSKNLLDATISDIPSLDKVYDGVAVSLETPTTNSDGELKVHWFQGNTQLDNAPANAGSYKVVVSVQETETYKAAVKSKDFTISKAQYTGDVVVPTGMTAVEGQQLSAIAFADASFAWKTPTEVVALTKTEYVAIYTTADGNYYKEVNVTLQVSENTTPDNPNNPDNPGSTSNYFTIPLVEEIIENGKFMISQETELEDEGMKFVETYAQTNTHSYYKFEIFAVGEPDVLEGAYEEIFDKENEVVNIYYAGMDISQQSQDPIAVYKTLTNAEYVALYNSFYEEFAGVADVFETIDMVSRAYSLIDTYFSPFKNLDTMEWLEDLETNFLSSPELPPEAGDIEVEIFGFEIEEDNMYQVTFAKIGDDLYTQTPQALMYGIEDADPTIIVTDFTITTTRDTTGMTELTEPLLSGYLSYLWETSLEFFGNPEQEGGSSSSSINMDTIVASYQIFGLNVLNTALPNGYADVATEVGTCNYDGYTFALTDIVDDVKAAQVAQAVFEAGYCYKNVAGTLVPMTSLAELDGISASGTHSTYGNHTNSTLYYLLNQNWQAFEMIVHNFDNYPSLNFVTIAFFTDYSRGGSVGKDEVLQFMTNYNLTAAKAIVETMDDINASVGSSVCSFYYETTDASLAQSLAEAMYAGGYTRNSSGAEIQFAQGMGTSGDPTTTLRVSYTFYNQMGLMLNIEVEIVQGTSANFSFDIRTVR